MITIIAAILSFLGGFLAAPFLHNLFYRITIMVKKLQMGICFHYSGKGYRETIDGTNSEFCINCNHPAGYHWQDKGVS